MFSKSIYERIGDLWREDQKHPHRDRTEILAPSQLDIAALVDVAYLASIRFEEGELSQFGLSLYQRSEVEEIQRKSGIRQAVFPFSKPLVMSVETLSKLAPAFSTHNTTLLVDRTNSNRNEFEIWGFAYFRNRTDYFDEIAVGVDGGNLFRPDVFSVLVEAPGSLAVLRRDFIIARFENGVLSEPGVNPLASGELFELLQHRRFSNTADFYYTRMLIYAIHRLVLTASKLGHGATIALLDSDKISEISCQLDSRYQVNKQLEIERGLQVLADNYKNHGNMLIDIAQKKFFAEKLDLLAGLSSVDGALLIGPSLEPLLFGATLAAPRWGGDVLVHQADEVRVPFDRLRVGTRHNSAIDFSAAVKNAVVFVASHDGPIRMFTRVADTVHCWPDCRSSRFVEA